jgi:hypothetical protein
MSDSTIAFFIDGFSKNSSGELKPLFFELIIESPDPF